MPQPGETTSIRFAGDDARGSARPALSWLRGCVRFLLRLFFRRIEVAGLENVPLDRGGILVAWHPNGLLDPGLILGHCPRRVVFGARHGLFSWPLLGPVLRRVAVPVYRPQDVPETGQEARKEANRRSLDRLATAVAGGSFAALFPEGLSHDQPGLQVLRPGAARLWLRAVELSRAEEDGPVPAVLPVGLHYDRKHLFGSSCLVEFHPPVPVPPELAGPRENPEDRKAQVAALTALLEDTLTEVVQATDTWETHFLMHRLRKLLRAERARRQGADPGPTLVQERILGFARVRRAYEVRKHTHPGKTTRLRSRIEGYDADLRSLGLEDHHLDGAQGRASPWKALWLLLQAAVIYVLLPPLLVLGYVVNVPVALALGAAARRLGAERKDVATLKLLLGAVAFPLVWLAVSLLVAWGQVNLHDAFREIPRAPWLAGLVTFLLCSLGGWVGLRYLRVASELLRALRVRLTLARRRQAVARLREDRAAIHDEVVALAEGLELPGRVTVEGKVEGT